MNAEITNKCIFCQSGETRQIMAVTESHGRTARSGGERFCIYECDKCRNIFLGNIVIDADYYKKYYQDDYYASPKSILLKIWSLIYSFFSKRKENIILEYFQDKKEVNILDFGCGSGTFLESLEEKKFIKNGLEINPVGAGICRKKGFNIYDQNISEAGFGDKKFDVVTMWHVLEHIADPGEILRRIHSILADDGILVIQVPNSQSLGFRYGKENWFHLDPPRHLSLPNRKSMEHLCKAAGFRIVKVENEFYDYPLDLFWSVRKSPVKFLIWPLYPIFKILSKEHLTFICRKS